MEKKMENEMETAIYIYISIGLYKGYMSYSLKLLKRGYMGDCHDGESNGKEHGNWDYVGL